MARRKRFKDTIRLPGSKIVPLFQFEDFRSRHERRLTINLAAKQIVESWCLNNGVSLSITNQNHHWCFRRTPDLVEWWPSTAKLVINKRYGKGIHVYDYVQVIDQLAKVFPVLNMDVCESPSCAYCEQPIVQRFVLFGDELLHPGCHIALNQELEAAFPLDL